MARPKAKQANDFVLFNVTYEDGSQSSNRKVPSTEVGGLDGEEPILAFLKAQDDEIAAKSGRPRGPIKSIAKAGR